ncbi:MAG: hypothetical protein AB7O62_12470 [Pirellulales bacterium]
MPHFIGGISGTRIVWRAAWLLLLVSMTAFAAASRAAEEDAADDADVPSTEAAEDADSGLPASEPASDEPQEVAPPPDAASETTARFASPKELFLKLGVQPSHFRLLMDGRQVDGNEEEPIVRFLYAMRRFDLADIERWSLGPFVVGERAKEPQAARGEIFLVQGRVNKVTQELPVPEVRDRFEIPHYYRCQIELADGAGMGEAFALAIPAKWKIDGPLDERVSLLGVFLKWRKTEPEASEPVFATQRVAWHPPTVLGDLGMDMGLFDTVKNRTAFSADDRECFYQMLAAAGRADAGELLKKTRLPDQQRYSVVPLFNKPETQHGELVALTGTARRVTEVRVSDKNAIERFGIRSYYQIEMFTDDSQDNPLTFCVRRLPPGMPVGPDVAVQVHIPGFFFKTWAYKQTHLDLAQKTATQLAPTLIGSEPRWIPAASSAGGFSRNVAAGLVLAAILGIVLAVWQFRRGDKAFRERLAADRQPTEEPRSLNDLGIELEAKPDFRKMGEESPTD